MPCKSCALGFIFCMLFYPGLGNLPPGPPDGPHQQDIVYAANPEDILDSSTSIVITTGDDTTDESPPTTTPEDTTTDIPTTTTQYYEEVHLQSLSYSWTAPVSPEPQTVVVRVDEGYSISVTVSDVNIDGDIGNYLLIRGGDSPDSNEKDGRIFTNSVGASVKMLYKTSAVYGRYENIAGGESDRFKVVFERVGELTTTTTTEATTTILWPTTVEGDSAYLLVNVSGMVYEAWQTPSVRQSFQTCVRNMARAYCQNEGIHVTQEITERNVIMSDIDPCPYAWPGSDRCAQIRFRLPIYYEEGKWTGYQLNSAHLKTMWDRYAHQYLTNDLSVFDVPDVDNIVIWWAVAIVVVTVVFVLLLGALRILGTKFAATFRRRRMSDTVSIVSSGRGRGSNISLTPHYLQETPKLFENEYPMVDPMLR